MESGGRWARREEIVWGLVLFILSWHGHVCRYGILQYNHYTSPLPGSIMLCTVYIILPPLLADEGKSTGSTPRRVGA